MHVFEMVAIIVVFGVIGEMFRNYLKYKGRKEEAQQRFLASSSSPQHEKQIAKLEERIAVLEKIITEDKYDLKREFDKLDAA